MREAVDIARLGVAVDIMHASMRVNCSLVERPAVPHCEKGADRYADGAMQMRPYPLSCFFEFGRQRRATPICHVMSRSGVVAQRTGLHARWCSATGTVASLDMS